MLLPFCYSILGIGEDGNTRSAYKAMSNVLLLCLEGNTRARLACRVEFDIDRYISVLLGHGLLSEASRWLVATEKGRLYIAHYDVIIRMLD